MKPYKDRTVELGMRVDVYRNLHTDGFSIKDTRKGIVLCHCESVLLSDAEFKVSEAGRKKTVQENRRRVHALVRGTLTGIEVEKPEGMDMVYYNPFKTPFFLNMETGGYIAASEEVYCSGKYSYARPSKTGQQNLFQEELI